MENTAEFHLAGYTTIITLDNSLYLYRATVSSQWVSLENAYMSGISSENATISISLRSPSGATMNLTRLDNENMNFSITASTLSETWLEADGPYRVNRNNTAMLPSTSLSIYNAASGSTWFYDSENVRIKIAHSSEENVGVGWVNTAPDEPTSPSPASGTNDMYSPVTLTVTVSDPDNSYLDVSFYDGSDSLIGSDNDVASGETASVAWADLSWHTTYTWYATASDGDLENTSDTWSFSIATMDVRPISETFVTIFSLIGVFAAVIVAMFIIHVVQGSMGGGERGRGGGGSSLQLSPQVIGNALVILVIAAIGAYIALLIMGLI